MIKRAALLLCLAFAGACDQPEELILASTTSTVDSGLLDELIPAFERAHGDVRVKVIAVGSGEAMALGRRRDADVLLVHSPADEEAFMAAGHGLRRLPVMANDYVIAGPPSDPAGVRGMASAVAALRRLAASNAAFVSRGDSSGTHRKELELWAATGTEPQTRMEVGQGMGEALTIASERGVYILTDRGTYLALSDNLRLEVLVEGDDLLRNPYSVITVSGSRHPESADAFADWLVSRDAAEMIRMFGVDRFGQPLFFPAVGTVSD
ncbi:MAG TPA: substrate-binding domain-containing protein [Longimicrobiales bacterium]|nr:substrate-binding domain-containing protein [Longimicrobiales bacterium]